MRMLLTASAAALLVAGCASKSADITPTYVSPIMYSNHNCQQLAAEAQGVSARAAAVSGAQDQKRTSDQVATGVAIVIFWPAAFLVGGDGPTAAELGQLKGQMVAIEQASIQKQCAISFSRGAVAGAESAPAATFTQTPPPSPVSSKQASSSRGKGKQNPPAGSVAPAPAPVVTVIAPPEPQLTEADRTMNSRN